MHGNTLTASDAGRVHRPPRWRRAGDHPIRIAGVGLVALIVLAPIALILYQSFLDKPFFMPRTAMSLAAYDFVLRDPEFYRALANSVIIAIGMLVIAVPLGALLAFLMTRTDMPGAGWIEPVLLAPVFISAIVMAFGYVVSIGPVGFLSLWAKDAFGVVPWNLYSIESLIIISGLTHVPHVYLYASAALRGLNPEVEEAARISGAGVWRVAFTLSMPLILPALIFSGMLVFLLGIEMFGFALILGDPAGIVVLTTYLYKLTNLLGTPSFHLMAVVAVIIVLMTLPLVLLQRYLLRSSEHYVTIRGKGMSGRPLSLGAWRWPAFGLVVAWLFFTVILPVSGLLLRSLVSTWGEGVDILNVLTLANYRELFNYPNLIRSIVNTILIAGIGGALAVVCYTGVALISHRWRSSGAALLDFLVMMPRALPGLIAGLAFLWIFLFVPFLTPLRSTLVSLWVAYTVVWLAYGMRLISSALYQVGPELEEAARVTGASQARTYRDVTVPLVRFGLIGSWLLIFMTFTREYSTGVYLLGPNTEVIGSMIISLFGSGGLDLIAAMSVINLCLVGIPLIVALRLGVRLNA
ncbi:Iron ABC transporter permease [Hyphomicrobiales bacterium]|nr:Iron ABC transporter permease [Hyphomicrobiales bacterium]CAH1695441.1 Iron ABC transporter permease [Hyphomicrobiales bacterium]